MAADLSERIEKVLVWQQLEFGCEGYFVEVGANFPGPASQTWLLERVGWRGVLVEPLPVAAEANRVQRPAAHVFQGVATSPDKVGELTLHVAAEPGNSALEQNKDDHGIRYVDSVKVRAVTLDTILEGAGATRVDLLSIDTEGSELDVLKGLSLERWRPRLIVLEDKLTDLVKHRYLQQRGYRLVKRTTLNNWYIPAGEPFTLSSPWERLKLFRKVFLGLPFRKFRYWRHH